MNRGLRLRWQLTLSHLAAVLVTLVAMLAAVGLLVTLVIGPHGGSHDEPVNDARLVALSLGGLAGHADPGEMNGILRAFADPGFRIPSEGASFGRPPQFGGGGAPLRNIAYIVLLGPAGQELASSDATGAGFSPPERGEWTPLAARALAGNTSPAGLLAVRAGTGPAALAAYPISDSGGPPAGVVVLAFTALPPPFGFSLSQGLAFFGAVSVFVLLASSVFAIASSSLVAYLLARRVVRRLERLGRAVEAVSAGQLDARVEDTAEDELGQLAQRFNHMAGDLQTLLRELRQERDRVAGLLKSRRELVASVSHELRTPVATARGYLESALRRAEQLPPALQSDLGTIEAEIGRLQRLIEDLFTLSRAEAGRLELRLEPTDVGSVVHSTVDVLSPLAWQQRRVELICEGPAGLAQARADAERLRQVLSNLLSNAVRHTPPGGLVAAATGSEDGVVRVDVRDTGSGISPEDLPRVFERFYRGSEHEGTDGAGLGLAVAKELVEAMGGTVQAESAVGEGSCFTVRLPRA
ncbi:MAG TPA: HAMP domain-containing sensor histidine kinase [Chloroflexota bacterium]|nr:HAMP domain-containing sensor histidine kinase [Chloroflexota bacterium]